MAGIAHDLEGRLHRRRHHIVVAGKRTRVVRRPAGHAIIAIRDILVLTIIVLVAVALIEGIFVYNATPLAETVTQTVTASMPVTSTSIDTVVSNSTATVVSSATTTQTSTTTQISTFTQTNTTTLTSILNYTTLITTTSVDTTTATVTTTATSTVANSGPFVVIVPGSTTSKNLPNYSPATIHVVIGVNSTVTWINSDTAHHTVTSRSSTEPFNSGDLAPGQTYSYTFTTPGTYSYVSIDANDASMKGTVDVAA